MEMVEEGGGEVIGLKVNAFKMRHRKFRKRDFSSGQVQNYVYAKQPLKAIIFALLCPGLDSSMVIAAKEFYFGISLGSLTDHFGTLVLWAINLATVAKRPMYNLNAMKQGSQTVPSEGPL